MKTVLVGCRTIEAEVRAAMAQSGWTGDEIWLESGLHNYPDTLRSALQDAVDRCQNYDRLLLAMGFCGNAIVGVHTGPAEMILPRTDDCISLLCGSRERRASYPGAYFFTEGWLQGERTIWHEYLHALEKYGEAKTKRIFSTMLHNYSYCALLDTGCGDKSSISAQVRQIGKALGLAYQEIPGTLSYLQVLLTGPWSESRFVLVASQTTITHEMLLTSERKENT